MANAMCIVANKGYFYIPHFVQKVDGHSPDDSVLLAATIVLSPGPPLTLSTPRVSVYVCPLALTVTAISADPALPKLSLAATVIVSGDDEFSVSVSDSSVLSTSVSEPLIVSFVVPLFFTTAEPDFVAASRPLVSVSVTEKVSGEPVVPVFVES